LYLENTFHDAARARALQLYESQLARDNVGLFKRLMAVHTRRPREFITHHVQNPKTHSRSLEYARVREDNARLVQRLLESRTFVNDKGSWDEHAQEHEEMLTRLSQNPKNCFVPNLKEKRRRDQQAMRMRSVAQQARDTLRSKQVPLQKQMEQMVQRMDQQEAKEMEAENRTRCEPHVTQTPVAHTEGAQQSSHPLGASSASSARRPSPPPAPRFHFPLPPADAPPSVAPHVSQPRVVLPYGTHLVAPALVTQAQYEHIHAQMAELRRPQPDRAREGATVPRPSTAAAVVTPSDLSSALFTLSMTVPSSESPLFSTPLPPSSRTHTVDEHEHVFFLQPRHQRARSAVAGSATDRGEAHTREAKPVDYPFRFPPIEPTYAEQQDQLASFRASSAATAAASAADAASPSAVSSLHASPLRPLSSAVRSPSHSHVFPVPIAPLSDTPRTQRTGRRSTRAHDGCMNTCTDAHMTRTSMTDARQTMRREHGGEGALATTGEANAPHTGDDAVASPAAAAALAMYGELVSPSPFSPLDPAPTHLCASSSLRLPPPSRSSLLVGAARRTRTAVASSSSVLHVPSAPSPMGVPVGTAAMAAASVTRRTKQEALEHMIDIVEQHKHTWTTPATQT
jgi:hypothetical protein